VPQLKQEDLFTMSRCQLCALGTGSTHLYSTAPVHALFSAVFLLILTAGVKNRGGAPAARAIP
jgi:hypothetical protein